MKSDLLPGSPTRISHSRRALVQPRFLAAAMTVAVAGFAYLATAAQKGNAPVAMKAATSSGKHATSLADLPGLIEAYGQAKAKKAQTADSKARALAIGTGASGYNLVETDLTSNTASDEREPIYAPGGQSIAFASNGIDADKDGKIDQNLASQSTVAATKALNPNDNYHIWVMNADGGNQRQVSGLTSDDRPRNQRHPSFAPTGTEVVYADGDGDTTELYVVRPFQNGILPSSSVELPQRRTFFTGTKLSPTWSPSGDKIVFACNANLSPDQTGVAGQFDLYAISPDGSDGTASSIQRLTGGSTDSSGNTADDLNPAYSAVNSNILYFSSNRSYNAGGTVDSPGTGRRIWQRNILTGILSQVTDPTQRAAGTANDNDDFPSASLANGNAERIAFQSDSFIDASDATHDLNIWGLQKDTAVFTPFVETAPRLLASDYQGSKVVNLDPTTKTAGLTYQRLNGVTNPEGIAFNGQFVYVADSGGGRVVRYDQESGNLAGAGFTVTDGSVPKASGLITDGNFIYVASGIGGDKGGIHRFTTTGQYPGIGQTPLVTANFSNSEDAAGKITDGMEGLTFSANNNNRFIFASVYSDDKINIYDRATGVYQKVFTKGDGTAANPLSGPTGITFGPDLNGDGFQDVYVCSSASDDVLAYMGPNPNNLNAPVNGTVPASQMPAGTFIGALVSDNQGTVTNLNAPEGIRVIPRTDSTLVDIYVSSFQNVGGSGATGTGNHINRYQIDRANLPVTLPVTGPIATPTTGNASFFTVNTVGVGYFEFNALATSLLSTANNQPAPTPTPAPIITASEGSGAALVITNIISSPANYSASGLSVSNDTDVVGEDKAADREPAFSRSTATAQKSAQLTFASTRLYAPSPSSNFKDDNGNKKGPSNPYGSNGDGGTHDIWGAAAQDTTPPALIPQGTGNQLYPVLAPGPQAPFTAPRTANEGLTAGGPITFAFVLSDLESGVATGNTGAVSVRYRKAGSERFTSGQTNVDENLNVTLAREGKPDLVTGTGAGMTLVVYDDGSAAVGGHEEQANAVKGDGIYYCKGTSVTPTAAGDYYVDAVVKDQAGNPFTYDNIWGFSTVLFTPSGGKKDLFVSDYTAGQTFPLLTGDGRFDNMLPVESYYLVNAGGEAYDHSVPPVFQGASVTNAFIPATLDIWRTLCRGQISQTILDSYGPQQDPQLDPSEAAPGSAGPFTDKTRNVAVSNSVVIWAAPYAGTAFVGPGTITDAVMQTRLKTFLTNGGRLFISGRDVAYALTNAGSVKNDFLTNELGADFGGETNGDTISAASKGNDVSKSFITYEETNHVYPDKYYDLEIPFHFDPNGQMNYGDAAPTMNQYGGSSGGPGPTPGSTGIQMDIINPQTANGRTLTTAYTLGSNVVGQRIETKRDSGLISRAVFFSFGFEGINRRYRVKDTTLTLCALDHRNRIASQLLIYFKTGTISGTVVNDKSSQPIPNLLLVLTGGSGGPYLVRTDAQGQYTLRGLPTGQYTLNIAFLNSSGRLVPKGTPGAQTSPAGFFDASPMFPRVLGGSTLTNINLRPIPFGAASLSGHVVTSKKTPLDFNDDKILTPNAVGMPVLVRSIDPVGTTTNGGRFAQIVKTDAGGGFAFTSVPSQVPLEVVFNPTVEDIPADSGLRSQYGDASKTYGGPNTKIGRRLIPDTRRPDDIILPPTDTFVVNDPDPVKYPDPDNGPAKGGPDADVAADSGIPIVVPEGPSIRGIVTVDGTPFSGATVELLDSKGASLSPARTKNSGTDGSYIFSDLMDGNYQVKATAILTDGTVATRTVVVNGVASGTDQVINIPIVLSNITGTVTVNGSPAVGAKVQLLTSDGKTYTPNRNATTDNNGAYTLVDIPNGSYRVKATQGATSGSVAVTITDKDAVADPIALTNQQLAGLVLLVVDGKTPGTPLKGATVEILTTGNKSLSPALVTTSNDKGEYSFDEVPAGTYHVKGSYNGDTMTSGNVIVVAATATNGPTITLALENLQVKVIDAKNKVVSGASVVLTMPSVAGSPTLTGVTNSSGLYTFPLLSAGSYTATAIKTNLGGSADVTIKRLTKPGLLTIKLTGDTTGNTNPTGFNVKGKIYQISIPYEDTNNPTSSNVSEKTGTIAPATTKVKDAFTVPPTDPSTGARNYYLQRFNPSTRAYEDLDNNSTITRGVGYLIQIPLNGKGTEIKTAATSSSRKALTDTATEKVFTVTLHRNPSVNTDSNNGRNLIGFGFNPDKFKSVEFNRALVTHPNGQTAQSVAEAVSKGWMKSQITTLDSRGDGPPTTVNAPLLKPFGGYTVQTLVDGLKLTFRNPVK